MTSLSSNMHGFEPISSLALAVDPVIQRIKEQLGLLAIGTVINDDPVLPGPINSCDFHNTSPGKLNLDSELVKDFFRILKTLEGNPIYQQSLTGGLSIGLTGLLKLNGYRVIFIEPEMGNIPQVKVVLIDKAMQYLSPKYKIVEKIPMLDGIHGLIDTIGDTVKGMLKMTTRK